ncbi:MAG: hypothetical protein ABIK15_17995 [Pseudomonadota bacterium]
MQAVAENKLIVILGGWNIQIFTKEWIGKFLLPEEELELELSLDFEYSRRISSKKIRIEVFQNRLSFIQRDTDDETAKQIREISAKLADYLPHTPVGAFGINYNFKGEKQEIKNELLTVNDSKVLEEKLGKISKTEYTHQFITEGRVLNLKTLRGDNEVSLSFNYHFNISSLVNFKELIFKEDVIKLKQDSIDIMNSIYGLEVL